MVGADDAALQERPERFDIVGVDVAAHPFVLRMVNALMRATEQLVGLILIGRDQRNSIARNLANEAGHGRRVQTADHFADHVALALNRADDAYLCRSRLDRENRGRRAPADRSFSYSNAGCGPSRRDRFRRLRLRQ